MINICKNAGRSLKRFMDGKIETCKEVLSSAQNRLILGIILVGLGGGLIASAYAHAPEH